MTLLLASYAEGRRITRSGNQRTTHRLPNHVTLGNKLDAAGLAGLRAQGSRQRPGRLDAVEVSIAAVVRCFPEPQGYNGGVEQPTII